MDDFKMTPITYSRWERIYFRLFGHWPQRVVDRRLAALAADRARRDRLTFPREDR